MRLAGYKYLIFLAPAGVFSRGLFEIPAGWILILLRYPGRDMQRELGDAVFLTAIRRPEAPSAPCRFVTDTLSTPSLCRWDSLTGFEHFNEVCNATPRPANQIQHSLE